MKTQVMQNKKGSESRSNAESIGSSRDAGTSQLMANVSNSPKMAAQRKQKDNVQLASKKKEVQKKGADEKKKK